MTAWKTQVGARDRATDAPFDPTAEIAASNVGDAIRAVYATLTAALAASVASFTALVTTSQYAADDAKQTALIALSRAQRAEMKLTKVNHLQIALHAQVYN